MKSIDNLESLAKDAAVYQRKIWAGHDNKDIALCLEGAMGLYTILTNAEKDKILRAAKYTRGAFWISDDAEAYQNFDSELEDKTYGLAELCLTKARLLLGQETHSVKYTIAWWKSYRHNDKDALVDNLKKEQALQMNVPEESGIVRDCTGILMEIGLAHKQKDRAAVDKKLEEYFKLYLPRVIQFKE